MRFLESVRCALRGVASSAAKGRNARIQWVSVVIALVGGWVLRLSSGEWLAVIICIGLVLMTETLNSSLEELADEVSTERRLGLGRAKDMAAGAVLIAAVVSLLVAAVIVFGRL